MDEVMRIAAALRGRGRSVEYALRSQTLSRQLKTASAAGARQAVLVRHAQLSNGMATVRTLSDGTESRVQLDQWLASA
jgi:histidyl-tRNA synthetase